MTTPNSPSPDVAYVWGEGSNFGQDVTEESAKNAMRTTAISPWEIAQQMWKQVCVRERATLADLRDGQRNLVYRMDLLGDISGYGASVMAYNWNIPHSQWIVLPFETQLGPSKGVSVTSPVEESGLLTLKRGGLWRVDAHATVQGYTYNMISPSQVMYSEIAPRLMIEVVDHSSGELISASQYDFKSELATSSSSFISPIMNAPKSGAFSKTFVLPNMPPEDDEDASSHWVDVRVALYVNPNPVLGALLYITEPKVLGGTKLSALTATRWSRESAELNYADDVPDGGNLG